MQEAVEKIAEWVRGNVDYYDEDGFAQDASSVYSIRTVIKNNQSVTGRFGNCRGYTNISIALLRAVGIPARYVSGVLLPKAYIVPFRTSGSITLGQSGPGFHAVHEIYYPSEGSWVEGDGQNSVHFLTLNFIKFAHAPDEDDIPPMFSASVSPDFTYTKNSNISSTIGNLSANYTYEDDHTFNGTLSNCVLLEAHRHCIATGIFDKVEIVSGPDQFKTGESVSYEAKFTSGDGTTYPTNWNWEIVFITVMEHTLYRKKIMATISGKQPLIPYYPLMIGLLTHLVKYTAK